MSEQRREGQALWRGVGVGGLSGLMFGLDTAVIAGTTTGLQDQFSLDPVSLGVTVSVALWGTLAGALLAGRPGDRFGSRDCLKFVAAAYLLSGLGCAMAWNWPSLLAFRVLAGLAVGASSVLAPVYLAEIAPATRRGRLVGAFQFNVVLGILVAYLSNAGIATLGLGAEEWRWKFAVTAAPSLVLLLLLFTIPNTPRWLRARGRIDEARRVAHQFGLAEPGTAEMALPAPAPAGERLSWRRHRRPMLLAIALAAFNQLSGINAILYYLNDIFRAAGFSAVSADQQAVAIGATNLIFTLLALTVIDRVGRRTLLLVGSIGLVASLGAVAAIYLTGRHQDDLLIALICFIASFAFSQGAVIWAYISEIFPTEVRARGQSLGSAVHWFADAVIAGLFPQVASLSQGVPFLFFAALMAVQFVVVLRYFPETKRLTLEEIAGRGAEQ